MKLKQFLLACFAAFLTVIFSVPKVHAQQVLGVHILHVEDLSDADQLLQVDAEKDDWKYVTIPFTLADTQKIDQWQHFFNTCKEAKIQPIVRLATSQSDHGWKKPSYKNIIDFSQAFEKLQWPKDERIVIAFNEPNHSGEWDGDISPSEYADILTFTANWFHTDGEKYIVLPAAMDLAAPNGKDTMEAFTYWKKAIEEEPDLFSFIDDWNSHSYPNPGFSSSPRLTAQNSVRGYQHELDFVKKYSNRNFHVYITETGWAENWSTSWRLADYYRYAAKYVWSDPRIVAVTPFLLKGSPGPFATFSFLDEQGKKTKNYEAYRQAIESVAL